MPSNQARGSRRFSFAVVGALAGALLVAASGAAQAQAPKRGGTLTIASEAEFSGFNPYKAKVFNQNTLGPASSVFETLFVFEDRKVVPRLALEFKESADRLSAVVSLRRGVKFHDGTPFDADAVVAHYNGILDPKSGISTTALAALKAVEKVDDSSVRFVLKSPWAGLQSALAHEVLFNFIESPAALKADAEGFHRKPVGTGPYLFKEWRAGDRVVLERYPDYWDKKLPYLDRVVYRVMPDVNSRYQSIRSGEVDIGGIDNAGFVIEAKKDPALKIERYEGAGAFMWNFNHSKPPFNDPRVRAAVVHAFNAPAMVDTYFLGTTRPTADLLGPNSPFQCPGLKWRGYDLDKAKALVKEVGKPIKVVQTTVNTPVWRRQATLLQQFLEAAGIEVETKLVEQSQNVRVGISGDYELGVWRFVDTNGEPDGILAGYFGGSTGFTFTRHDSKKIDALLDQARAEPDRNKRGELYCQIQQVVSDEAIALIPVRQTYYAISHPYVKDVPPMQDNIFRARAIWLDK